MLQPGLPTLPMRPCRKTPHDLSSWSAAAEYIREAVEHSKKKSRAAEYIREVREYVAEHGRPPRISSSLAGTAEYRLRRKVQKQVKKGRFSKGQRKILTQLFASKAPAGGSVMPTNGRRSVAASGELPVDSASQQAVQPRASSSGTASGLLEASLVFILSLADCARAVTDAAFLEPEACAAAAEAAEVPKWKDVPKFRSFKTERPSRSGKRHRATKEEQGQQCKVYRLYATWARRACWLSEAMFQEQVSAAHRLPSHQRGTEGLPACLKCWQTTARNHAVLLCRAAGLRKASESCEAVRRLGGRAEMDRLLALAPGDLELERCDMSSNLRQEAAPQLTEPCGRAAEAQLKAVVGLFRIWLFRVGAQELEMVTEAWKELQAAASSGTQQLGSPPREFALDRAECKFLAFAKALYGSNPQCVRPNLSRRECPVGSCGWAAFGAPTVMS